MRAVEIEISTRRFHCPLSGVDGPSLPPRPGGRSSYHPPPQSATLLYPHSATHSAHSVRSSSFCEWSSSKSPILTQDSLATEFIREALYASHTDTLQRQPSLRRLLKCDSTRLYFASVAFAMPDVATHTVTIELQVKAIEEDNALAMRLAKKGRISRCRDWIVLEEGVAYGWELQDARDGRRSVEGSTSMFANQIDALSLGMIRLKAFKEQQEVGLGHDRFLNFWLYFWSPSLSDDASI